MSIICTDGKIIAADSMSHGLKIYRLQIKHDKNEDSDYIVGEIGNNKIYLYKNGKTRLILNGLEIFTTDRLIAIGSDWKFALAALHCSRSAIQAAQIACTLSCHMSDIFYVDREEMKIKVIN